MNTWLILALLAPLFWGMTNPIDSTLRRAFIKNDFALTWAFMFIRLLVAIPFVIYFAGQIPLTIDLFLMLLVGLIWVSPFILYFKALEREETTRVILLLQLVPLFVLILASIFIDEVLSFAQGIAFLLILIGGSIAAVKRFEGQWKFSKVFWILILANLLWAIADVGFKALEPRFPSFEIAFLIFFLAGGISSLALFFTPKKRREVFAHFKGLPAKAWVMLFSSHFISMAGFFAFTLALSLGKASLTSVIAGLQPLYAFLVGLILAKLVKESNGEDLSASSMLTKLASLTLIMVGLFYLGG